MRQSARVKLNGKDLGTVFVKPFHASGWPVADQGLLGPVTLQPEKEFTAAP